jgi:hypothetical protein
MVPFRRTLIAVLILLGIAGYLGGRHLDNDEPRPSYDALLGAISRGGITVSPPAPLHGDTTPAILSPAEVTIEVSLDPARRPYDVRLAPGATVDRLPLVRLHAPTRKVLFMGGEEART